MKGRLVFLFFITPVLAFCQSGKLLVAGSMIGYTELRTARIWVEVSPQVSQVQLTWTSLDGKRKGVAKPNGSLGGDFNPITFTLTGLEPATSYNYQITAFGGGKTEKGTGRVSTRAYWDYRTPAPDITFLAGSCSYVNEPAYDRPGKPYGGDSSIFLTMADVQADFMVWLGDNWYTRDADYHSPWGLRYRAHHDRSEKVLQPFLKAMPHYAIWDDHDYGPNDFSKSYIFKKESRQTFMDWWANPSYGMDGAGIYSLFAHYDISLFLLDDRSFRSNDGFKDSVNGQPDTSKEMFGRAQMEWLKDALLTQRYATFKIIATGSQMLNPRSPYDCFRHFPREFAELMAFIEQQKITGVVFLTGDRHHSEVIRMERAGTYPLYDITASPLTSHVYAPGGVEQEMPERVQGSLVSEQNFAKISVTGGKGERKLSVQFLNVKGEEKGSFSVSEKALR